MKLEKIKQQKRISLRCPECSHFGLMNIKGKIKVENQINYYVCCPKCDHNFKQIGRRFNFWRYLKKKHKLKHKEMRTLHKEFMSMALDEHGDIAIELDALPPDVMRERLEKELLSRMDKDIKCESENPSNR